MRGTRASKIPEGQPTVRISAYWDHRQKRWDLIVSGEDSRGKWMHRAQADSTVSIDEGRAWLMLQALRLHLESALL